MGELQLLVLGPLEIRGAQGTVHQKNGKQAALVAALAVRANTVVLREQLIDALWDDNPPERASASIHTYVCRLRRELAAIDGPGAEERITTELGGYKLSLAADELDIDIFRAKVRQARVTWDEGRLDDAAAEFRSAMGCWRGPAMAGVPGQFAADQAANLEEERLGAQEDQLEVGLARGRNAEAVAVLHAIVARHPLRERLVGQLMTGLYRLGRQAEALTVYETTRSTLATNLGIDPGAELQNLYQQILNGAPELVSASAAPAPGSGQHLVQVPKELPADIDGFVGRDDVNDQIQGLVAPAERRGVAIVLISGTPGVGKTALAVHIGHEADRHFPDGQLYADLRGHAPAPALEPAQVLARFLIAFGIAPQHIPTDLDSLTALYRTTLSTRRVLILLDNAASAQQVRPLLPSVPGCAVLVTSRSELRGLVALQGARGFRLGMLSAAQSHQVLVSSISARRVDAEPDAAAELAGLCGHLPLALRIAAANLAARTDCSVRGFVAELQDGDRLGALEIEGDAEAAVGSAFALSYASLPPDTASTFRHLGLIPGPHFTVDVVAAMVELPHAQVARQLDQLDVASLIIPHGESRYRLHDLLRLYAVEQCAGESATRVHLAKRRLHNFYLRYVLAAADVLFPSWLERPASDEHCVPRGDEFSDADQATAWMDAECLNVLSSIEEAVATGFLSWAWQMAEAVTPYLVTRGWYRDEGRHACAVTLEAAIRAQDQPARAAMHSTIGSLCLRHGEHALAIEHFRAALEPNRACGSLDGEARALIWLGNLHHLAGRFDEAAEYVLQGMSLVERTGNQLLRRFGLLNLGYVELHRGRLDHAEHCVRELLDQTGDGQVSSWEGNIVLGEILLARGFCAQAVRVFSQTWDLYRQGHISRYQAYVLARLADAHREMGNWESALYHAAKAVTVARDSGAKDEEGAALISLAAIQRSLGNYKVADQHYRNALDIFHSNAMGRALVQALLGSSGSAQQAGDRTRARSLALRALTTSRASGQRIAQGWVLNQLAWLALDEGDWPEAAARASEAADLHQRSGAVLDHARALHVWGVALAARGAHDAAGARWDQAKAELSTTEITATSALRTQLASATAARPAHR